MKSEGCARLTSPPAEPAGVDLEEAVGNGEAEGEVPAPPEALHIETPPEPAGRRMNGAT